MQGKVIKIWIQNHTVALRLGNLSMISDDEMLTKPASSKDDIQPGSTFIYL
jgi:hypothetical protein